LLIPLCLRHVQGGNAARLPVHVGEPAGVRAGDHHDRAFVAQTRDGGKTFELLSWITLEKHWWPEQDRVNGA
jgi:hypothetical protein